MKEHPVVQNRKSRNRLKSCLEKFSLQKSCNLKSSEVDRLSNKDAIKIGYVYKYKIYIINDSIY